MGNTLAMLLLDLTDRYEFVVRPFNSPHHCFWEAQVTDYNNGNPRIYGGTGPTANEALQKALLLSRKPSP